MRSLPLAAIVLSVTLLGSAHAQQPPDGTDVGGAEARAVASALTARGFENVAVGSTARALIVTYENRLYRYDLRALQQVLIEAASLTDRDSLVVIPRINDLPILTLAVPVSAVRAFRAREIDAEAFQNTLRISIVTNEDAGRLGNQARRNASIGRFDLLVHPAIAIRFGNFSNTLEMQLNLIPEIQAYLWKGASARAQLVLPIYNELGSEGDFVRPGLLVVNQSLRLPHNIFVSASAGYFTDNRYGLDAGVRLYLWNGFASVGGDVGLTGFLSYESRNWRYDSMNLWTPSVTASYRLLPAYDFVVRATYGRFLYQDTGFRFDATRSFDEVRLTLFGIVGEGADNLGFSISIPFPGSRYARPGHVRFRLPRALGQSYRFKNAPLEGIRYQTGFDTDRFDHVLNPAFVRNNLVELSGWNLE